MRYIPKELPNNVNISHKSPLKELASMAISILGIILIIYVSLGLAVDIIVPRLPVGIEENLGKPYLAMYKNKFSQTPAQERVQKLLDSLVEKNEVKEEYRVHIIENELVNALALPGRNIIVFSGLLEEIESENELAFVLAHELGHFANKDHLRGLGRGLVFFVLSSVFLGQNSSVSNFLGNSLTKLEMKFSQAQEKNADLFALDLLHKKYGRAEGAIEFLEKMQKKEKLPKFLYFFSTHPHSQKRIKTLKEKIQ